MITQRRFFLFMLFLVGIFCAGVLFRPFVYQYLIAPAAQLFWLAWRILLSVDQKVYWTGLLLVALLNAMRRFPWESGKDEWPLPPDSNAALESVRLWRNWIQLTAEQPEGPNQMKQNLLELVAAVQTSERDPAALYETRAAIQQGKIPLKPSMAAFLLGEAQAPHRAARTPAWQWASLPQQWLRKVTGRQTAEAYQSVEEVIAYLEAALEMNYDGNPTDD